ncbi:EH signature domain-containing protein [Spiribacter sp. 218]|uniref:EH signature domain-containing protein n=1 Tax=Spiribacter pallidus TaxID=1987936 RepID=UPI00349F9469
MKQRLRLLRPPDPPAFVVEPSALGRAEAEISGLLGAADAEIPSAEDLRALARVIWAGYRDNDVSWSKSLRRLRMSPWAVLGPYHPSDGSLSSDPEFVAWYIRRLQIANKPRAFVALAHAYLYYFDTSTTTIDRFRDAALEGLRAAGRSPRSKFFLGLHQTYGLLDQDGHKRFAREFRQTDQNGARFLEAAGLGGSLNDAGFVQFAFGSLLEEIKADLANNRVSESELNRRLSIAFDPGGPGFEFRFGPIFLANLANALLEPFIDREPEQDIREAIKALLLEQLEDPRLKPIRWNRVSETARAVFMRWLVEGTLEDFFRLLDQQAKRFENADRQWPYRSAFWLAYLREGHITDAWVALGQRISADSRRYLSHVAGSYADLRGGDGARSDHAVLIMRVGGLVVTEWSHSAKVRIWVANSPSVPKFYKRSYNRSDLVTGADFEKAHHAADRGNWQSEVEGYVRQQTGIRFNLKELMPNGRRG